MSGAFTPDPSLPSILELAKKLWGEPTDWSHDRNEARFGTNGSKSIKIREAVWRDHEANEGGGYNELYRKAEGTLPPRKPRNGSGGRVPPWENVGTVYRYLDAVGQLVLEVVRTLTGSPRFVQRRPNGFRQNGEIRWKWSVREIPAEAKPLYRLPELLAAPPDRIVWICEGEKDADNLVNRGLIATTNVGGAGKWRDEYAAVFHGKHAVVLPDNDPPGVAHGHTVGSSLYRVAASVRVLTLPGLAHKGDVSDWLAAGGVVGELERLALEAPLYVPPPGGPPPGGPGGPGDGGGGGGDGGDGGEEEGGDEEPPAGWAEIPPPDAATIAAMLGELVTELRAVDRFVTDNRDELRFNHSSGTWLTWADHYWRPDERKLAFLWAKRLAQILAANLRGTDTTRARLVIERVRFAGAIETGARVEHPFATAQGDWDNDPWLLGTPGGVIDLRACTLRDGLREDLISRVTGVRPAETPDCPTWLGFLTYAMHDSEEMVRFIQRYFGYGLTGLTSEEVFLFLFGPGGAGKGTTMETMSHIMGDYGGTLPIAVFTDTRAWSQAEYYRADMAGKRLLVANEPERNAYWAEGFLKEVTGGDTLSGRHPMGRPFTFRPVHKLTLQGNHMPRLRGRSSGIERRLRILPFTRKPEKPDRELKRKLLAEAPGILRWLMEGCLAWQKLGSLAPPDAVRFANSRYFEGQDAFAHWVDERCILDRSLELAPGVLRADFNAWAKANGEDEMNGNAFTEAVEQFEHDPPLTRGRTNGKRWIRGLGLLAPPPSSRFGN